MKKNGNICMTHKAFNGRVIVQYMAEACDIVISKQLPGNGRTIGVWLSQQVALGHRTWPYPADPEFGLASVCLKLDRNLYCKMFGIKYLINFELWFHVRFNLFYTCLLPVKEISSQVVQLNGEDGSILVTYLYT